MIKTWSFLMRKERSEAEVITEWGVVGVIVTLIGLFIAVYTPMSKNTKAMAELTSTLKMLNTQFDKFREDNHDSHKRLWEHNEAQDEKIADHDKRLTVIEKERR